MQNVEKSKGKEVESLIVTEKKGIEISKIENEETGSNNSESNNKPEKKKEKRKKKNSIGKVKLKRKIQK